VERRLHHDSGRERSYRISKDRVVESVGLHGSKGIQLQVLLCTSAGRTMQPLIFESVWQDLEAEYGRQNLRFPKELILLGGAPGAGKGTNTAFISRTRGLTCAPIVISALLDSPEARAMKDAGHLAGDREVAMLLLRELLKAEYYHGVIIDGFPRTNIQVECLKLLVDKMHEL